MTIASQPVQWTSNSLTVAKMSEKLRGFLVRQYLEAYQRDGGHNPACATQAVTAIKTWLDYNYGTGLHTNHTTTLKMWDALVEDPACDDPMVWTLAGANTDELHEAVRRLEHAVNDYKQSHYKGYPKLYATVKLGEKLRSLGRNPGRSRDLDTAATQLLAEALSDGSIRPEDQDEIADIMVAGWGQGYFRRNGAAAASVAISAGESFQWLALMFQGQHERNEAWAARGNGFADSVTEEGWKGFSEHLGEAQKYFSKGWELRPDLPFAATQMMSVSLGTSGLEEMRHWFDRAVAVQVDNPEAWSTLRWGLRPRWYGSHKAMLAFGVTALKTGRFDSEAPGELYNAISDIESDLMLPLGQHIYGREDIWPHLQRMYEGYIAEPARAKQRDGWRSAYSMVAYLAGKYDVARTQLEAIHWRPFPEDFDGRDRDVSLMPVEVAARTGAGARTVAAAESRCTEGDIAGALQIYTKLNADRNLDERTRIFIHERLTTLTMQQRLSSNDWVDFLPAADDLAGWAVPRGKCARLPDGALEVETGEQGHIIFPRAPIRDNFEVRGSFEVVRSSNKSFQAGLLTGVPRVGLNGWYTFRIKRNSDEGDVVSFADGWTTNQLVQSVSLNDQTNTFHFRFQQGLVNATVNHQVIFKDARLPESYRYPICPTVLGFGAYTDANETVIRYRNVQVRLLSPPAKQ